MIKLLLLAGRELLAGMIVADVLVDGHINLSLQSWRYYCHCRCCLTC